MSAGVGVSGDEVRRPGPGWAVFSAGLAVVVAAAAATAHGLYVVARGSGAPAGIAWLYPVITDGLALVAYAATTRLRGPARRYGWAVVVLAAGLSGLAQAVYLAGALPAPAATGGGDAGEGVPVAPAVLRFGVGAWPAVAAAVAAHLLFLIGAHRVPSEPGPGGAVRAAPGIDDGTAEDVPPVVSGVPAAVPPGGVPLALSARSAAAVEHTELECGAGAVVAGSGVSRGERARRVAVEHAARTGGLPTVRELAELAGVGRGTADRALSALRSDGPGPRAEA